MTDVSFALTDDTLRTGVGETSEACLQAIRVCEKIRYLVGAYSQVTPQEFAQFLK